MIKGLGLDIAAVDEMKGSIEEQEGFLQEVFTEAEIAVCSVRPNPYQCFAGRFAAKEAFMKAVGLGWTSQCEYLDIDVISDGSSVPTIKLSSKATQVVEHLRPFTVRLSMSHTEAYACAVVVLDE